MRGDYSIKVLAEHVKGCTLPPPTFALIDLLAGAAYHANSQGIADQKPWCKAGEECQAGWREIVTAVYCALAVEAGAKFAPITEPKR